MGLPIPSVTTAGNKRQTEQAGLFRAKYKSHCRAGLRRMSTAATSCRNRRLQPVVAEMQAVNSCSATAFLLQ